MFKAVFFPTSQNATIWLNALYMLVLLLAGVIDPVVVFFAYFIDTMIIGVFNALKIYYTIRLGNKNGDNEMGKGLILFFLFHYGFFIAVQSVFGFLIFTFGEDALFKEAFNLIDNYTAVLQLDGMWYVLVGILVSNAYQFLVEFIGKDKYLLFTPGEVMMKPYVRIFIQQFVVIIIGFFAVLINMGLIAALLLIGFRLIIDLILSSIKKDSKSLDYFAKKLVSEKMTLEEMKQQLLAFTE